MRIPFVPLPLDKALKKARRFRGIGSLLLKRMPNLEAQLIQAQFKIKPIDYASLIAFTTTFWFLISNFLMVFVVIIAGQPVLARLDLLLTVSLPLTLMSFLYLSAYPLVQSKHRMHVLERDLLFALRHGLIEVKAGVTLFRALVSIARGGYGVVSEVFDEIVKDINVGAPEQEALEKAAFENPSLPLRKSIWQISNSLKAGADIAETLTSLVADLEKEQLLKIRQYGQEMNPYTMMYMMLGIILPSLGITFLIVMSAFMGTSSGATLFYLIIMFVLFFQVFFLSFVKSKQPMVIA